jgi:OPA family glycerol-3-phosphate transporter-like MFS transporter 1/2
MMSVLFQGVVEYSLSLFFAKLVSYTFLYWLPLYIKSSSKSGRG